MSEAAHKQPTRVAVVVAVHNRIAYTREFVRSLFESTTSVKPLRR